MGVAPSTRAMTRPFGREDVDLVLAEVELQRLEEGDGVVLLLLDVGEALHPGHLVGRRALFVAPVRGHAELGASVHLLGADLHLDGLTPRADHRRVQRLVEVELRRVDVVLESSLHRRPERVDRAERRPAVALLLDDQRAAPPGRRSRRTPCRRRPSSRRCSRGASVARGPRPLMPNSIELCREGLHDLAEVGLTLGLARGHHLFDLGVALGVQGGKAEVLELPLDLLDTEAVRERRVDVEGLLGDGALTMPSA